MTSRQIRRTMDFILRSQANAVIRMERWEEEHQRWKEEHESWDERFERKLNQLSDEVKKAARENRRATAANRQEIRKLSKFVRGQFEIVAHSLANHSHRLDTLEKASG